MLPRTLTLIACVLSVHMSACCHLLLEPERVFYHPFKDHSRTGVFCYYRTISVCLLNETIKSFSHMSAASNHLNKRTRCLTSFNFCRQVRGDCDDHAGAARHPRRQLRPQRQQEVVQRRRRARIGQEGRLHRHLLPAPQQHRHRRASQNTLEPFHRAFKTHLKVCVGSRSLWVVGENT